MTSVSVSPDLRRIGGSAFVEVLGTLLSLPTTVPDSSDAGHQAGGRDQITRRVQLTGQRVSGSVRLRLPRAFMMHTVRFWTGLDGAAREDDDLLADAAGELANMVAGRVAAQLATHGFPCELSPPSIAHSVGLSAESQPGVERARVDLVCEGHRLGLEIECRFASV